MKPKRQRFVLALLGEARGNASEAARLAGYSVKTATQIGSRLLRQADVKAAVEHHQATLATKAGYTADKVIAELATIADATPDKITGNDKIKALELLGKAVGLFQPKDNSSDRITVNIGFMAQAPTHDTTRSVGRQVLSSRPSVVVSRDTDETT